MGDRNDIDHLPARLSRWESFKEWFIRDVRSTDVAIVLLTAGIVFTSYLQWRVIRAGSSDTHALAEKTSDMAAAAEKIRVAAENMVAAEKSIADESQKAIEANNKQSKAALDAAIDQTHIDQRAWVAQIAVGMDAPESEKVMHGSVTWSNSGKTFAKKVHPACYLVFRANPIDDEKALVKLEGVGLRQLSIGVLAPGARYNTPIQSIGPLTATDKELVSGNWYTYIWGDMTYDDIFGHAHTTTFCALRQGVTGDFVQCPFHNGAD